MDWLRNHGYRFVGVDDLLAARAGKRPLPPKAVLVTFDDAYQSAYVHAWPVLKMFRIPAVVSVVGSWLEQKDTRRRRREAAAAEGDDLLGGAARDGAERPRGGGQPLLGPAPGNPREPAGQPPAGGHQPALAPGAGAPRGRGRLPPPHRGRPLPERGRDQEAHRQGSPRDHLALRPLQRHHRGRRRSPRHAGRAHAARRGQPPGHAPPRAPPAHRGGRPHASRLREADGGARQGPRRRGPSAVHRPRGPRLDLRPRSRPAGAEPVAPARPAAVAEREHRLPAGLRRPRRERVGGRRLLPEPPPADAGRPLQPGGLADPHPDAGAAALRLDPGPGLRAARPATPPRRTW